jgi:hypothetical protein
MPDGRIDMRFPRLRCRLHDIYFRNTFVRVAHRKGMGCARTSSFFDSPYDSFLSSFIQLVDLPNYADIDCMQLSKHGPSLMASLCNVLEINREKRTV